MFAKTAVFLVTLVVFVDAAPLVSLRPILESGVSDRSPIATPLTPTTVTTPDPRPLVPVTVPNVRYKLGTLALKRDDVGVEVGANIRNKIGFNFDSGINRRFPFHSRDYGSQDVGSGPSDNPGLGSGPPDNQGLGSGPSGDQDIGSDPNTQDLGSGPSGGQGLGSGPSDNQGLGSVPSDDQGIGSSPSDDQGIGPGSPDNSGLGSGPSDNPSLGSRSSDTQDMGPDPSGQDVGPDPSDTQDVEPFDSQFAEHLNPIATMTMGKRGAVDLNTLGSQIIDGLKTHGLLGCVDHFSVRIQRLKDLLAGDVSSVQITAEAKDLLPEYHQVLAGLHVNEPVAARHIVIDPRVLLQLQSFVVPTVNLLNALGKSDGECLSPPHTLASPDLGLLA